MATIVCQLSCLSSINRRFKLHKLSILNRNNNNNKNSLTLGTSFANTLKYTAVSPVSHVEATKKNPFPIEENSTKKIIDENSSYGYGEGEGAASPTEATRKYPYPIEEYYMGATKKIIEENPSYREGKYLAFSFTLPRRASSSKGAKLPDYFLGYPYACLVLHGEFCNFILSGDWSSLIYGLLGGYLIYYLNRFSQLARREGKSGLPYTLGQAVFSALLMWRNLQNYLLTKALVPANLAPASLSLAISAAMLCFYLYVIISGGNPPPGNGPTVLTMLESDYEGNPIKIIKEYIF